jgi:hypothetical protein
LFAAISWDNVEAPALLEIAVPANLLDF